MTKKVPKLLTKERLLLDFSIVQWLKKYPTRSYSDIATQLGVPRHHVRDVAHDNRIRHKHGRIPGVSPWRAVVND
jgi:hypothetical protein